MNESNTYQAVRIGDIADWRLICVISAQGIGAWLRHASPTQELVTLFDEKWNADSGSLLERIENTVYDHPQVLDDFSADIAVVAPRSIWKWRPTTTRRCVASTRRSMTPNAATSSPAQ